MNYYSHNIGDYAQATAHLSLVEDAIYSRLLRRYYAEEQPIVDNLQQVFRWVGARTEDEREAAAQVLSEFFVLRDGHWHNKRADVEIAAYQGLFPPRTQARGSSSTGRAQRLADWTEELREVLAEDGRPRERFMGTIDATR
ncbi:YdaU family protein [Achromobacter pestifer]|uniref:YdaU family protein n=1 Tax=Achromobacter pestifer TaxID=1353889 RepID=A0A7D4I146_9BURK|nr:YdaU family protein [Achromobacter pestifer]QKH37580.1 YdaU family protein [Achromobacter pestifer]